MKRKLTAEQAAARDARKAKLKGHIETIARMSDDQRAELMATLGAVVTCEGHPLSPRNCMLLALQLPQASIVGGFRQWIKAGRVVRKGQHGAGIYFPKGNKKDEADEAAAAAGETKANDNGPRFLLGTVFDISQTDELTADHGKAAA